MVILGRGKSIVDEQRRALRQSPGNGLDERFRAEVDSLK
jgi:hypothetical protein